MFSSLLCCASNSCLHTPPDPETKNADRVSTCSTKVLSVINTVPLILIPDCKSLISAKTLSGKHKCKISWFFYNQLVWRSGFQINLCKPLRWWQRRQFNPCGSQFRRLYHNRGQHWISRAVRCQPLQSSILGRCTGSSRDVQFKYAPWGRR